MLVYLSSSYFPQISVLEINKNHLKLNHDNNGKELSNSQKRKFHISSLAIIDAIVERLKELMLPILHNFF